MKLWHCTLIMVLTFTLSLTGCGGSSKDTDLHNYLTQVEPLIEEGSDMAVDLLRLAEDAGPFGLKNADQILATYSERYDDLLSRFEAIECPKDAVNLRKYTIEVISYIKQMVDEMSAYITTLDTKHIDKAESYATAADESILLAMDEWDRLSDMAGKENGISIVQIFLGLLALGVAVSIALFVLQLTLGVGFGVLGGITVGIGAIVEKIKGGDKRREQKQARQLNYDSVALESQEEEDEHGVWEIYRKEWETANPEKRIELNKRMFRWQELMKGGLTASQAYIRVMEGKSVFEVKTEMKDAMPDNDKYSRGENLRQIYKSEISRALWGGIIGGLIIIVLWSIATHFLPSGWWITLINILGFLSTTVILGMGTWQTLKIVISSGSAFLIGMAVWLLMVIGGRTLILALLDSFTG